MVPTSNEDLYGMQSVKKRYLETFECFYSGKLSYLFTDSLVQTKYNYIQNKIKAVNGSLLRNSMSVQNINSNVYRC